MARAIPIQPDSPSPAGRVICGDALASLKTLASASVQCIVTSPPYFQQRDYGVAQGQVGREAGTAEYVETLVGVFAECRRVLRDDGLLWLNLGDKFREGELLGLPWRVALALQASGWILRCDIIWHKPNAMPSSGKTRPTMDHEYVFLCSKTADYYYDADAIREPHVTFSGHSKMKGGRAHFGKRSGTPEAGKNAGSGNLHDGRWDQAFHPLGRNKRTVWNIPLSKFRGAHFAVFPEKLVETCILAGSRAGDVILDPFGGSGTVGVVARRLGRTYLLIELNPAYCQMIEGRLAPARV